MASIDTHNHRSVEWSRKTNARTARIQTDRAARCVASGTPPPNDAAASADEMDRAIEDLGLQGMTFFSNAGGADANHKGLQNPGGEGARRW